MSPASAVAAAFRRRARPQLAPSRTFLQTIDLPGESLNLTTHGRLTRALAHPHYTFRRKLSHTADSQNRRRRMTPASRPVLTGHLDVEPDYETPALIHLSDQAGRVYHETMAQTWEAIGRLKTLGVSASDAAYPSPNAVSIRFTESADLLNLRHKHGMRPCWPAQEEIRRASVEEAEQISAVLPPPRRQCPDLNRPNVRPITARRAAYRRRRRFLRVEPRLRLWSEPKNAPGMYFHQVDGGSGR